MSDDDGKEAALSEIVSRKARRLARARGRGDDTWRHAAQVGVLAWMFVVPIVLAGWLAKVTIDRSELRWLAVVMLAAGAVLGGLLVKHRVRQLLEEDAQGEREDEASSRKTEGEDDA